VVVRVWRQCGDVEGKGATDEEAPAECVREIVERVATVQEGVCGPDGVEEAAHQPDVIDGSWIDDHPNDFRLTIPCIIQQAAEQKQRRAQEEEGLHQESRELREATFHSFHDSVDLPYLRQGDCERPDDPAHDSEPVEGNGRLIDGRNGANRAEHKRRAAES